MIKNIVLLAFTALASAEIAARVSSLDALMLKPLLYYQDSDLEVQEPSPNPERLYQLKPGATTHTLEFQKPVSINSLGFRDMARSAAKAPETTRIICLGGSTTYGAAVGDDETFPHYLEQALNREYKGKFEVWTAGLCAYVLSSETAYAREIIEKFDPDVLIFQYANIGRRAFTPDAPYASYFRRNPELYRENLRFIPFPRSAAALWLLRHCAAYRSAVVLANCFMFVEDNNPRYNNETANLAMFSSFCNENKNRLKIFIMPSKDWHDAPNDEFKNMLSTTEAQKLDIFSPNLLPKNASSEYFLIHPPAHVYKWYAQAMAKEMERHGAVVKK